MRLPLSSLISAYGLISVFQTPGSLAVDSFVFGQIVPTLIAERLSIAALVNRQGICADFIDCLINSFSH